MSHVSPTAHDKDSAPALTWWRALLVLAVAGAWSWAAHVASTRPEPTTWGVLLAVMPMSTAVVVTLWRSDRRWMAMLVLVLLIAVVVSLWPRLVRAARPHLDRQIRLHPGPPALHLRR